MKTLAKDVYKVIRHRVSTGEITPGSRVTEFALARELGISRAPIREAIGKLTAEGLLERVPNVGAFVRVPDPEEIRHNFELRAWIEGKAAAKTATQITDVELTQLQRCCDDMRRLVDQQEETEAKFMNEENSLLFSKADLSFHVILLKASGNERALSFLTNQHLLSRLWSSISMPEDLDKGLRTCEEHSNILAAVRAGDQAAAGSRLEKHILIGMESALSQLEMIKKNGGYASMSNRTALEEQLRMIEEDETDY